MRVQTENVGANAATLTCYLLDNSTEMPTIKNRPAVLIFPGGGYMACSDREAEPVAMAYLKEGYHAFVLRYSAKSGEQSFPKAFEDAKAAFSYIRTNAEWLCVDADKIAIAGFSAGGHLASCMGTIAEDKPAALILGYPVILEKFGFSMGEVIPGTDQFVSEQTPPTFVFSTQEDSLVPIENTLRFTMELSRYDVPFESHVFLTGDHGLSVATAVSASGRAYNVNGDVAQWVPLSVRFLKNVWGEFALTGEPWKLITNKGIMDQPLKKLRKNAQAWDALCELLPELRAGEEQLAMAMGMSLNQLAEYNPAWDVDFVGHLEAKLKENKTE